MIQKLQARNLYANSIPFSKTVPEQQRARLLLRNNEGKFLKKPWSCRREWGVWKLQDRIGCRKEFLELTFLELALRQKD